jgi:hypothetical protein
MRTLFANGLVFDGSGAPAVRGAVVIEGDRIVDVSQGNGDEMDADVRLDLAGAAVVQTGGHSDGGWRAAALSSCFQPTRACRPESSMGLTRCGARFAN